MRGVKRGCAGLAIMTMIGLLAVLCLPYRLETVEGAVSANETGCTVEVANYSGWKSRVIGPLIDAEDVAYPLQVYVFVTACSGVSKGRPYAAGVISVSSGKLVARGLACGNAPEADLPCRLEMPAVRSLEKSNRYVVRVLRAPGEAIRGANVRLHVSHEWRNVVLDAIGSV